ncbi:phage minor head protein [Nitrosomonas halophila]|uniref:Phage Mu protein F like protein n=1 Tax=Nitrosomonas halophila TaxID=44576 RepID=A0A1H3FCF9_9PROT|nr:phage minor head protein [Nitrosomonas halophila]SDX88575.1 Phage Mu protein F like protein [Nitrosomonas halophila]
MFEFKRLPPEDAIAYFRQKGYRIGFSWQDVWQQEHQAAFTVAKAMQLDILRDIRAAVDNALAEGTPFEQFRSHLSPLLMEKGWWGRAEMADPQTGEVREVELGSPRRLKLIFDTNLRTAHSEGQWARIQDHKEAFPYLMYDANNSEHPRLEHSAWDGLVLPVDDPFWAAHYPVKAYNCKCGVIALTDRMLAQRGLTVDRAPQEETYTYVNKRTGEVQQIPRGVDPSFNYPPGGRRENLNAFVADKLDAADETLAAGMIRSLVSSGEFGKFHDQPEGVFPIGVLRDRDAAAMGAKTHTVRISAETMKKQQAVHPEITAEEYGFVQSAIENGKQIQDTSRSMIYILEQDGYVTVVKATKTGRVIFMTSFRRLSANEVKRNEEIRRLLKKAE